MKKLIMKIESKIEKDKILIDFTKSEKDNRILFDLSSRNINYLSNSNKEIIKPNKYEDSKKNDLNPTKNITEKVKLFEQLKNILDKKCQCIRYKNAINKYFFDFIEFLNKRKRKIKNTKKNEKDTNNKIIYNINEINIDDAYYFVYQKYKNYKENTKKYILSKLRRYIRILNNNEALNFKNKLSFPRKKKKENDFSDKDLIILLNYLKMKNDFENLIIFYFLYYSGITFSDISRIRLSNFKSCFSILQIKKGKKKYIHIPSVIQTDLIILFKRKQNLKQTFFYESISDATEISRIELLKKQFSLSLKSCIEISQEKIIYLLGTFSKTRGHKILSEKLYHLFDINYKQFNNQLYLEYEEKTKDKNNNNIEEVKNNELISKEYDADNNNNESLENSFSLYDTPNIIKNKNIYSLTDREEINKLKNSYSDISNNEQTSLLFSSIDILDEKSISIDINNKSILNKKKASNFLGKKTKFNLNSKKIYETRNKKHILDNLISSFNEDY